MAEPEPSIIAQELAAARTRIDRGWALLIGVPGSVFALALGLLITLRTGMLLDGKYRMEDCVRAFPLVGESFRCQAILVSALPAWLHVETPMSWLLLHLVLSAGLMLACVAMAWQRAQNLGHFRAMVVWVVLSSLPGVLLQSDVHYDVYALLGGSILGFARRSRMAMLGGLLFGLAHPEQAVIAAALWAVVVRAFSLAGPSLQRAGLTSAAAGAILAKVYAFSMGGASAGRWDHLWQALVRSLANALKTGSLGVYACYGVSWVLILGWLATSTAPVKIRILVTAALIVVPGAITLATLDGTRVFLGTAWPAYLVFLCHVTDERPTEGPHFPMRTLTVFALLLALVTPGYVTHGSSIARPMLRSLLSGGR